MATQQELEAAIESLSQGISNVADGIADLGTDIDEAVKTLQEQIASGQTNLGPSIQALASLSDKAAQISASIKALDDKAEGISGKPTPPPAA